MALHPHTRALADLLVGIAVREVLRLGEDRPNLKDECPVGQKDNYSVAKVDDDKCFK